MKYLMKCGHVAQSTTIRNGKLIPVCAICVGLTEKATIVEKEARGCEGLENRNAKCRFCNSIVSSNWDLPFFEYKPDQEMDSYYNGCFGWD